MEFNQEQEGEPAGLTIQPKTHMIRTDVISIRSSLMKQIDVPPTANLKEFGVRKNCSKVNRITSYNLERLDELAHQHKPEGEMLVYWMKIFREISKNKPIHHNEDDSTVNNWSVLSETCPSEFEQIEECKLRINQLKKRNQMKKNSLLECSNAAKKSKVLTGNDQVLSNASLTTNSILKCTDTKKRKNSLKWIRNKRTLDPQKIRVEAFYFMNQLGKKLRSNERSNKLDIRVIYENESMCNNKVSSNKSSSSSNKSELLRKINKAPMSPIKRRKEITSPSLNIEQNNFLNLCTFYKSENFMNFDDYSDHHQKNSSMTPVKRKRSWMISEEYDQETRSCSKLNIKQQNNQSLSDSSLKASPIIKPIHIGDESDHDQVAAHPPKNSPTDCPKAAKCTKKASPQSKTNRKNVKKAKTRKNPSARRGQQDVSADVILGLSFILENMESDLPSQPKAYKDKSPKVSGKLSRNDKSPEKHSRRASIVKKKRRTIKMANQQDRKCAHHKLQTMFNLEMIISSLDEVIEEDRKRDEEWRRASTINNINFQTTILKNPVIARRSVVNSQINHFK